MQKHWDVIVVGAGPAGMACAAALAEQRAQVLLLDEQSAPGGQLYRNIEAQSAEGLRIFGGDYSKGLELVARFRQSNATYLPAATVWKLEQDGRVCFSRYGVSHEVQAKRIVIATGAMERPVPFKGWTLPGVIAAGGVDALFKSSGILPDDPVTMVGSGPLMLLVAHHLHAAGKKVQHMLDTTPRSGLFSALPHLPRALSRTGYLLKGVGMMAESMRIADKTIRGVTSYKVSGERKVNSITFTHGNKTTTLETGIVLAHEGIVPRTEFSRQLRLTHKWDTTQRYWYPKVDPYGRTSAKAVFMIGDGAYVHGGVAATMKGELAACAIADDLGLMSHDRFLFDGRDLLQTLQHELTPRPFVDAMYRPRPNLHDMPDDTLVCRCEEVTAGDIRAAVASGQTTPEMVKAITRCGMGPCQGRMCTPALHEIMAAKMNTPVEFFSPPTVRPPVRNLGLGELAKMQFLPSAPQSQKEAI